MGEQCREHFLELNTLLVSPTLFASKAFVEERQYFGYVELDILKIQFILIVFLHLEQIIEFEIELQQTSVTTFRNVSFHL